MTAQGSAHSRPARARGRGRAQARGERLSADLAVALLKALAKVRAEERVTEVLSTAPPREAVADPAHGDRSEPATPERSASRGRAARSTSCARRAGRTPGLEWEREVLGLLEQIAEEACPSTSPPTCAKEREQRGRERHERHERHEREQEQAALRAQIRARPAGRRPSNDQADPESTAATTAARIARRQNRP